jgi:hypothetical protein
VCVLVHIKDTFVWCMAVVSAGDEMLSRIGFFGVREIKDDFQLYTPCFDDDKLFQKAMREEIVGGLVGTHEAGPRTLWAYEIKEIAELLQFEVLTDILKDELLVLKSRDYTYIYFGVITKNYVYVACWLARPTYMKNMTSQPKICFWMLQQQYIQLLLALGIKDAPKLTVVDVKKCLNVSDEKLTFEPLPPKPVPSTPANAQVVVP